MKGVTFLQGSPLVVENEPPVTFLRRKMTGGRFSIGVVIRRYTGLKWNNVCMDIFRNGRSRNVFSWWFIFFIATSHKTVTLVNLQNNYMTEIHDNAHFADLPHVEVDRER